MRHIHRRPLVTVIVLALVGLVVTSGALAGSTAKRKHHKQAARAHRVVKHPVRRTFAPTSIAKAAEVSAVELDKLTQQFMQVTFDRGRETAVGSASITLQQKQDGAVWRTQVFTVPSNAVITYNRRSVSLSQIPTGSAVRIESSGAVGGTQSVVRVDAFSGSEASLPAST